MMTNRNASNFTVYAIIKRNVQVNDTNVTRGKELLNFIMSSLLLSKTCIFAHNVGNENSVIFRIGMSLESLQYLDKPF